MNRGEKIHALAALKGLFIWIIVLHNTFLIDALLEHIPGMAFIRIFGGDLGNSMFFMLSGFLISWGYRERIRNDCISFGDYLRRRIKKLYPMYAISNAAALLVAVWQYGVSAINLKKIAFTFLLLQGGGLDNGSPYNSPTWFVSALFFCYILYYTGTRWAKSYTGYCVFLAAGIAAGYYFSITEGSLPFCFSGNGVGYLNFFLGCALAELYALLEKRNIHLKVATLTMLLVSLYLMLRYGVEIISGDSTTAFAFVISPFVIYLAYDKGVISYILNWKILQYLGKISMGVFYWHLVIYIAVRYAFGGMSVKIYGLYLLTVLLVAALTESFRKKNA